MSKRVAVLGAGMHPWGKWGRPFVEYGVHAAREALADAGLDWTDIQYVAGADTIRNGYPGFVAGATFAQALGWTGAQVSSSYAACASGAAAIANARAQILAAAPGMLAKYSCPRAAAETLRLLEACAERPRP